MARPSMWSGISLAEVGRRGILRICPVFMLAFAFRDLKTLHRCTACRCEAACAYSSESSWRKKVLSAALGVRLCATPRLPPDAANWLRGCRLRARAACFQRSRCFRTKPRPPVKTEKFDRERKERRTPAGFSRLSSGRRYSASASLRRPGARSAARRAESRQDAWLAGSREQRVRAHVQGAGIQRGRVYTDP